MNSKNHKQKFCLGSDGVYTLQALVRHETCRRREGPRLADRSMFFFNTSIMKNCVLLKYCCNKRGQ